ncbi:MAG: hypothetical protein ACLR9T_07455 [Thomasclavelia sp.]
MNDLGGISKKLNGTIERLKGDKDIGKAVGELQGIKDQLKKIVKESTR